MASEQTKHLLSFHPFQIIKLHQIFVRLQFRQCLNDVKDLKLERTYVNNSPTLSSNQRVILRSQCVCRSVENTPFYFINALTLTSVLLYEESIVRNK